MEVQGLGFIESEGSGFRVRGLRVDGVRMSEFCRALWLTASGLGTGFRV